MLTRRLLLALLAAAALTGPVNAGTAENGLDVTLITYKGLPADPSFKGGTLEFRGHGKWLEKNTNGTYTYKEKSKTASKLTLYDASRKATVIVEVKIGGVLSWIWNGSAPTPYGKIKKLEK